MADEQACALRPIDLVLFDGELTASAITPSSANNSAPISIVPAKRGHKSWKIHGVHAQMRHHFPEQRYQRKLLETTFSTAKRKLSQRAPGRSVLTQALQALLLGLAFNVYRLSLRLLYRHFSEEFNKATPCLP